MNQPTPPSFALPLPPKAKRQTSLPSKTTTADDVHDETTSDELTHSVPQETTTDGTKCAVPAETDAETTSTTSDANIEKQVPHLLYVCTCLLLYVMPGVKLMVINLIIL